MYLTILSVILYHIVSCFMLQVNPRAQAVLKQVVVLWLVRVKMLNFTSQQFGDKAKHQALGTAPTSVAVG